MKVIHINTYDVVGGAARAAYRIHKGLINAEIDSILKSRYKFSNDDSVLGNDTNFYVRFENMIREKLERAPLKFYRPIEGGIWSPAWFNNRNLVANLNALDADIINLHWINLGFLSIEDIDKIKKPVVWTLHDMWPFTGGCHYAGDCLKYKNTCHRCPQLNSKRNYDLSTSSQANKIKSFRSIKTVVCPSLWMYQSVRESTIFRNSNVTVIPYGMDTNLFKPFTDKKTARKKFNLNSNKILILFPGYPDLKNKRKGFEFVVQAIRMLSNDFREKAELLVLGQNPGLDSLNLPIKINYINRINDDTSLAMLYSLADFSLCSSTEDNLPNTVLESLACGTPVVGFEIGGIPDMIVNNKNGFLIKPFDPVSFSFSIKTLIESNEIRQQLSQNARTSIVNNFNVTKTTKQYIRLYEESIKLDFRIK